MPLLPYWTGDLTAQELAAGAPAGAPWSGWRRLRAGDMLIIHGISVYPTQVGEVLATAPAFSPHCQPVVTREATLDLWDNVA